MKTKISKKKLPIAKIQLNRGQIEGLPSNPRKYTEKDIEDLAVSLKETPELTQIRIPIVVPFEDSYVVLGGNRRLEASLKNEESELECYVLEGASIERMKEIVIKDNGSFGKWDEVDLLQNWSDMPLQNWGVEFWKPVPPIEEKDEELEDPLLLKKKNITIQYPQTYDKEVLVDLILEALADYPECSVR